MKQMAFRGIDSVLEERLRMEARRNGASLNRTVIDLLKKVTGISNPVSAPRKRVEFCDLDDLIGKWNKKEARGFDKVLSEQRRIDPDIWK